MPIKKNPFHYFALSVYLFALLYILISGFGQLGEGTEYPYLYKGLLLAVLLGLWLFFNLAALLTVRLKIDEFFRRLAFTPVLEFILVVLVLGASAYLRFMVIAELPMTPESDYKTYYEIAQLYNNGTLTTEGIGYCDYVAMFPHVMGYALALAAVFNIFGTSILVGQIFNLVLAVVTVFVVYRTARLAAGRLAGIIALLVSAFWPSQILYGNFLASEYLFTFLLFVCVWLFTFIMKRFDGQTPYPGLCILLHILLGVLLAYAGSIRPMAILFLIVIYLCLIPNRLTLPVRPRNDQPVALRVIEKGWLRCVIITLAFLFASTVFSTRVSFAIDRELPGGSASFGYNLLVGLNTQSVGGWNETDSKYLYDALNMSGNAAGAQAASRDLALKRLTQNPKGLFNLFMQKYQVLWSNDNYGSSWNILFLDQHGELTPTRKEFLYGLERYNNMYYLIVVCFAGIAGIYLRRRRLDLTYPLMLLFLGTAAMHLLVENQNRYHYHSLPAFAILAAASISYILADYKERAKRLEDKRAEKSAQKDIEAQTLAEIKREQAALRDLRTQALEQVFDMEKALKEGHIRMTVSEAYRTKPKQGEKDRSTHEKDRPEKE